MATIIVTTTTSPAVEGIIRRALSFMQAWAEENPEMADIGPAAQHVRCEFNEFKARCRLNKAQAAALRKELADAGYAW